MVVQVARIRTIKPDFWTDGKIVKLSPFARLLYIGMWNFAICDNGHVSDDSFKLKLQILPVDDVDVDELLSELIDMGRVVRVTISDGRTFLHVKRLPEHQKTDSRWSPRCPACVATSSELAETQVSSHESHPNSPNHTAVKERKGKESITSEPAVSDSRPKSRYPAEFERFWSEYPRKEQKGDALKAWQAALKQASNDELIDGATRYGRDPNRKSQYTKLPAGWLRADMWLDGPIAGKNSNQVRDGKSGLLVER